MNANVVISTHQLTHSYKIYRKEAGVWASLKRAFKRTVETKYALKPLDLEIYSGQIVGLVGANGAGKTTLLKLLSGLIYPTNGTASVLGYCPWERSEDFLSQISLLLGQKNQLWWDIPAYDSFDLLMTIYNLDRAECYRRVEELATRLNCLHVLHVPLRRLSLGERMKMELIGSLLHGPKVLYLDEPTIGLDVVAQNSIRQFILEELKGKGVTVILTSHYMDDIAQLADRLLLMSHGEIAYDGTVEEVTSLTPVAKRLVVDFTSPLPQDIHLSPALSIAAGSVTFSHSCSAPEVLELLQKISVQPHVKDLRIEEPDFEDVIRLFMEKESRVHQARHRQ